jgi:hypothetical protein
MIEQSLDYRRINRLATWAPLFISNEWKYLVERQGDLDVGLWGFQKDRDGYRVHAGMGADCMGKKAIQSLKGAIAWIFKNTEAKAVYAVIPEDNKPASIVAIQAGLWYTKTEGNYRFYEVTKWVD